MILTEDFNLFDLSSRHLIHNYRKIILIFKNECDEHLLALKDVITSLNNREKQGLVGIGSAGGLRDTCVLNVPRNLISVLNKRSQN